MYIGGNFSNDEAKISINSNYLTHGEVEFDITVYKPFKLALRIPDWCNEFEINKEYKPINGYAYVDIKELGTQLKKVGMLIVQDQVWNRVTVNRSEGKATRYYIDEFHLLLKEEQTAAYSVEIWKRFRKWAAYPQVSRRTSKTF